MRQGKLIQVVWLLASVVVCASAYGADWPQLQGPDRNGISPETGLLHAWPDSGPRELWSLSVGQGFAGAAVRDGEVYVLDRVDDARDVLRCLGLNDGQERWRYEYDAPGKVGHNGSRTPPTVDEQCVYSVGLMGHFVCTDRKTHKPVWQKNLLVDHGLEVPGWGVSQAPVLYKDLVIVAPQAPDAYVAAFNKTTGDLVWQSPGLGLVGYSSPVVATLAGVDQVVMVAASNKPVTKRGAVAGLSLEDGSLLWSYDGFQCYITIPYAEVLPGDRVFVTGGYKAGSAMFQVTKGDGGFKVAELFKLGPEVCGSQIHQPLFIGDHLYVNSNSNERQGGMLCLALDGAVKWRTSDTDGLPTFERGNLIYADGMIIALDGKTGILHLVDPSPEGYKELARAKVLDGKEMWGPMALSDGKLIVRGHDTMKCLDLKNP